MKPLNYLILLFIGATIFFTSCIDDDYNWDNINKDGVLPVGNIPLGDIEKLTVKSLLPESLDAHLKEGDDGIFYLEFTGNLDINQPEISVPYTDPVSIETERYEDEGQVEIRLRENETRNIVEMGTRQYQISEPFFEGDNWTSEVDSMTLTSCDFIVELQTSGLSVSDGASKKAYIEVLIQFPSNITLADYPTNTVKEKVYFSQFHNNRVTLSPIRIKTYRYNQGMGIQDITYSVDLVGGDNTTLHLPWGYFNYDMTFYTENITPDIIYGDLNFSLDESGLIADITDLGNAFSDTDILNFNDVEFTLNVETNLGADFNLYIDELSVEGSRGSASLSDITNSGLLVKKPTSIGHIKSTSFLLAKEDKGTANTYQYADLTPLFNKLPEDMGYKVRVSNDGFTNKKAFYPYGNLIIDAGYTAKIPLKFTELSMLLEDTTEDVFDEDLTESLFFSASTFKIVADDVSIDIGGDGNDLELVMDISFLDENHSPIGVDVTPVVLDNTSEMLEVIVNIHEEDVESMAGARHLKFNFDIRNKENSGGAVSLRNTDSIIMKGVKFKSDTGIKFEID